jgi:hypothetical protein
MVSDVVLRIAFLDKWAYTSQIMDSIPTEVRFQ